MITKTRDSAEMAVGGPADRGFEAGYMGWSVDACTETFTRQRGIWMRHYRRGCEARRTKDAIDAAKARVGA